MPDGFPPPIRRVVFSDPAPGTGTVTWTQLRQVLCAWAFKGCCYVERDGHPIDITTLAKIADGAELGGAVLVVMHEHLALALPSLPFAYRAAE